MTATSDAPTGVVSFRCPTCAAEISGGPGEPADVVSGVLLPAHEREAHYPRTLHEAIARVMRELPGIGKDSRASEQQGGYSYRGIEAITRELQGLCGRYGITFTPKVLSRRTEHLVVNGKPWTDENLEVIYWMVGPGGAETVVPTVSRLVRHTLEDGSVEEVREDIPDERAWYLTGDCKPVGPIHAIGRDNSDKGCNKAMTQAYKYALLQGFQVSDGKDDADSGSPATDQRGAAPSGSGDREKPEYELFGYESPAHLAEVNNPLADLWAKVKGTPHAEPVKAWAKDHGYHRAVPVALADGDAYRALLEAAVAAAEGAAPDQAASRAPTGAPGDGPEPDGATPPDAPEAAPTGAQGPGRRPRTPRDGG